MAIQELNSAFQRDIGQIVVSAIKRQGVGNELGLKNSWLGLLGSFNRIEFMPFAPSKMAEKMVVPYASAGTAEYYDLDSAPQAAGNESVKTANIAFASARDVMRIRNFDEAALKSEVTLVNEGLLGHNTKEAMKNIVDIMEKGLRDGLGVGSDPYGMAFWVNNSSVYGNIDQAVDTWSQATLINAGGSALSLKHLREAVEGVVDANGGEVQVIVSSARQRNKYRELIGSKTTNNNMKIGDAEYSVEFYDDIPWVVIPKMTNSVVYGLNMETFVMKILLQKAPDGSLPQLSNIEQAGLPFAMRYLGNVNDDARYAITNYHQLVCRKPWQNFKIYGLSTSLS